MKTEQEQFADEATKEYAKRVATEELRVAQRSKVEDLIERQRYDTALLALAALLVAPRSQNPEARAKVSAAAMDAFNLGFKLLKDMMDGK